MKHEPKPPRRKLRDLGPIIRRRPAVFAVYLVLRLIVIAVLVSSILRREYESAFICLLVLVLDSVTGGASTARLFCVYRAPLTDPLTYVRFFTHVLGHSGYSHYMGNMLLLLLVGPGLEEKYGSRNLLLTIVITAFATGLVQFLLFPHSALLGASGVVFMMIVLSSFTEMKKGGIPLTMLLVVALYLGSEIADGLTKTDNVSHLTHIVGGVSGIVFGFRLARAKKR